MKATSTKIIDFKKLSPELLQEGITAELLDQVQDSGKLSPAILTPGGEPSILIKSNPESYWIQNQDGTFIKEGRELKKIDLKTCIIARARYWLLFSDSEIAKDNHRREKLKEREVQAEVEFIKRGITEKVKKIQSEFNRVERWAYNSQKSMEIIIMENVDPQQAKENHERALAWMKQHPEEKKFVDQITQEYEAADFDSLYLRFESDGTPLLFSTSFDDPKGMEVVKKLFSKDKIENTLEKIAGRSHIESVAIMKIERRYAQVSLPKQS